MADVTLTRFLYAHNCTLGVLHDQDNAFAVTLEDPWRNNKVGESCIPTGLYSVAPHSGTKYKDVWQILNVPGRSAILLHSGNSEADTRGCVLLGTSFVPDEGKIAGSRIALDSFRMLVRAKFPGGKFSLQIRDFQSQSAGPQLVHTKPPVPSP